jgi:homopolymeric O-antigen transport system permease protein
LLAFKRLFGLGGVVPEVELDQSRQQWVIEPVHVGVVARAKEFWRYRRILWFFAGRRIKERYESTTLGKFWLFARPLMPIFVSTIVFGTLLKVPSPVPYFLFFLAGNSCWRIFDRSLFWSARSFDQNRALLKKVYFPRLIAPVSAVAPAVTEFAVLLGLLFAATLYYLVTDGKFYLRLGFGMLLAPVAIAMVLFLAISVGLWMSVFVARHKDFQFSIRYFTQFWHYLTPVLYPLTLLPTTYELTRLHITVNPRMIAQINPLTAPVELYKWALLGIGEFPGWALLSSLAITLVVFASGVWFFTRAEGASVDRL